MDNMNYEKIYNNLIDRAKNRVIEGYSETHHIVPSCVDGDDIEENLVILTPAEHYLAHLLLVKMSLYKQHPNYVGLIFAAHKMTSNNPNQGRSKNKLYEWLRIKAAKVASQTLKGRLSTRKGKTYEEIYGPEKAKKLKEKHSNYMTKNHPNFGEHLKPETCLKISLSKKDKSYEEIMGEEKAKQVKEKKSKERRGKPTPMKGMVPWNKGKRKNINLDCVQ
jgi:hypothetical protein